MADRERDYDENEGSPDPETLYTKEYCIGTSLALARAAGHIHSLGCYSCLQ